MFAAVYLGMALGRWPGLRVDRTGIALLGAILLYGGGALDGPAVLAAIDFPTLIILFGLMILSAQFAACGFYDWCSARIATAALSPAALLALTVVDRRPAVGGAGQRRRGVRNDAHAVRRPARRGLDPRPFVIALAGGANAGSAATIIGNPQNILIGEVGRLDFWQFLARLRAARARRPRLRLPGGLVALAPALRGGRRPRRRPRAAGLDRPASPRRSSRPSCCCCCSPRPCPTSRACCWSRAIC